MDEKNEEGICGTSEGYIMYLNFKDNLIIPIVSKPSVGMEPIEHVMYDTGNNQVFLTNCGK